MGETQGLWQFWIDRGGTFTDCLGRDPATGTIHVVKVLSSDRAPLVGIRRILGINPDEPIPASEIRMGTTVATNALLERRGAATGLVITRGFGDLLEIGTQARPRIFEIDIDKPAPVYREVLETDARADPRGSVLARPDPTTLKRELEAMSARGVRSLAVVTMHAYRSPEGEREIGQVARQVGFDHVALSHEVASEIGMVGRGDTTLVDAYLTPLIKDYVAGLLAELPGSSLGIMQSSGGLTDAGRFRGPDAILSGPAGGVVACARVAEAAGFGKTIGFDMGGTSTDVSRYDGEFERVYETEVAGVRVRAPMMSIHTVAAGGGSLCRYDGHKLTVGPESAGSDPGPLCYGHPEARELSLTDVNLILGRIVPDRFPIPLDVDAPRSALEALVAELGARGDRRSPEQVAEGFFTIANSNMAEAIRQVSVARGYDVRDYALVVFGGAGGQHACALARSLGIRNVVFHPYAGVLSAYGMGLADTTWHDEADAGREPLDDDTLGALQATFDELEQRGRSVLTGDANRYDEVSVVRRVDLRYAGTETSLTLPLASATELRAGFESRHRQVFGYARPGHTIELVQARVEAIGHHPPPTVRLGQQPPADAKQRQTTRVWFEGAWHEDVPVVQREALVPGKSLRGPALVLEATGTIVLEPGFVLDTQADGVLVIRDEAPGGPLTSTRDFARPDPILLTIMGNLYMSIAEQMGHVLRRTALSTNIRERLDFSCAIFDRDGGLVANAPHIPVHLGAMGESVAAVIRAHPDLAPGQAFVTNDPAQGGSHLPDVTVVTPVHDEHDRLLFFTASRGHHEDIGGITPGSMPPFSRQLSEEGVVLAALRIVSGGRLDQDLLLQTLRGGPYPARNPSANLADIEAQLAANATGAGLLRKLVAQHGLEVVAAYMQHVQDNAATKVAEQIASLPDGSHRFEDRLDDGTPICVTLRVRGSRMDVDFAGTGAEQAGNLNAPHAVTVAAVIYVLRSLVGEQIPLNSGCLRPVRLHIPQASLLSPSPGCAVAGGNVETSQRVVDVLLGAVGRAAASQGTMNNLSFGNRRFGYYETIAGGSGASREHDGASAVHTHMTNTRITDPEVLEARFPVRLVQFAIRRGSGGAGRRRGGDGVIRELEALEPMRISILSERRDASPFGLMGGQPGSRGRNLLNGQDIGGKASIEVAAGDRLRIETPGGGGYGAPSEAPASTPTPASGTAPASPAPSSGA